jgi:glycine/D-amino acid oxidase-like deaminating enzyme
LSILTQPVWQTAEFKRELPARSLPLRVDVLVVGAGYTGLSAARVTAQGGANTWVLDAGPIGAGCSGRNGGQVAFSIKPSWDALSRRHGPARAQAICAEGLAAMAYLRALATEPDSDCGWQSNGCFFGAHTPRHFAALVHEATHQPKGLEQRVSVVTRAEQGREIATDFYHGGIVYHDDASVDPMRLLLELLRRAQRAGATVVDNCEVTSIVPRADGYDVHTAAGVMFAGKVLIATNGYSKALSPWHRRRVIPIGSYQIATEQLGLERVRELIPNLRNITDARRVVVYFRPSRDGERIIFGGRAALAEQDPLACVPVLRAMLTRIFPQLTDAAITHAWVGWVAYTFDKLLHLGRHANLFHCMGYCGQGVPMAPYFGMRIGQQMLGLPEGRTAFDELSFETRPYYFGTPWFLAPSVLAYRTLDRMGW